MLFSFYLIVLSSFGNKGTKKTTIHTKKNGDLKNDLQFLQRSMFCPPQKGVRDTSNDDLDLSPQAAVSC